MNPINTLIERASLGLWPKHVGGSTAEKRFIVCLTRPYRKPTQVGECKRTQARERNLSKELGTLAPQLREKGCPRDMQQCVPAGLSKLRLATV